MNTKTTTTTIESAEAVITSASADATSAFKVKKIRFSDGLYTTATATNTLHKLLVTVESTQKLAYEAHNRPNANQDTINDELGEIVGNSNAAVAKAVELLDIALKPYKLNGLLLGSVPGYDSNTDTSTSPLTLRLVQSTQSLAVFIARLHVIEITSTKNVTDAHPARRAFKVRYTAANRASTVVWCYGITDLAHELAQQYLLNVVRDLDRLTEDVIDIEEECRNTNQRTMFVSACVDQARSYLTTKAAEEKAR